MKSGSDLIEVLPVEIDHRIINAVSVADGIVKTMGAKSKKQVANFIMKKLSKAYAGDPFDKDGKPIDDPKAMSTQDFYYEIDEKDFIFVIRVSIESATKKNRKIDGCIMHIISVEIKLKDV